MGNEVDLRKQRKVEAEVTIDTGGLATEPKQDAQIVLATLLNTYVDGLEALLVTLNAKDFATETTLLAIKGFVDGIETILGTISTNTTGLNLEATQLLVKGVLDNIKLKTDNLDVLLSTRSSEATLIQVRDYLDTVETKLQSIITVLPTSLGQKTMANSLPVVISSDQTALPISGSITASSDKVATSVRTTVSVTTTATLILASNVNRKKFKIFNDAGAILYFGDNNTITATAFSFRLSNNEFYEDSLPVYTGNVYAIRGAGSGNVHVTEYTT